MGMCQFENVRIKTLNRDKAILGAQNPMEKI
jgi:hypothetical protein